MYHILDKKSALTVEGLDVVADCKDGTKSSREPVIGSKSSHLLL